MNAEAVLETVLDDTFPARSAIRTERIVTGNHKQTFVVTLEGDRDVVVQLRHTVDSAFGVGPLVARLVADRTSVPVALVLALGECEGVEYVVSERVRGTDLHQRFATLSLATQTALVTELGRLLGSIHEAFSFDGYGVLEAHDGTLRVQDSTPDWPTVFSRYVESALFELRAPLDDLAGPVRRVLTSADVPAHPRATLFPWDFRPGNTLVEDGNVTAVLDWDAPLAAHAELSLAKAEYLTVGWYVDSDRAESLRTAFYEGYESVSTLPADYWTTRRRYYRLGAIVASAMDSLGRVTQPGYPPVDPARAAAFHRRHIDELL